MIKSIHGILSARTLYLLNKYPAAAAYSLRRLSNDATNVVRVRRSVDNAEDNFTADEITDGTLLSWVGGVNLLLFSEQFDNPYYFKNLGTLTTNQTTAPDGSLTADLFTKTSGVNTVSELRVGGVYSSTGIHTYSIYVKQNVGDNVLIRLDLVGNTANATFNFSTKTISTVGANAISATATELSDGWFRLSLTGNVTSTAWSISIINLFTNPTNDSVYVWGAQLNEGATAGDYAPTTSNVSGYGYVTTWYDQSGNSNDATQATATKQPQIVSGGSLITSNGYQVIQYDGTDDNLITSLTATGTMLMGGSDGSAFYEVAISGSYGLLRSASNTDHPLNESIRVIWSSSLTAAQKTAIENLITYTDWDFSDVTSFTNYWRQRSELTDFPLIDISSGISFINAWRDCSSLTSFPLLNVSSGTNFSYAWRNCTSLTSFPLLDVGSGTNFQQAWYQCTSLTSFPLLDISNGTNFFRAWLNCTSLTSFPLLDVGSGTNFQQAWYQCTSLQTFPANMFDSVTATDFTDAFTSTNLSSQSIENIVVSIDTAGQSSGTLNIAGGGNATTATAQTAIDSLTAKGWTVTVPDGYVSPYVIDVYQGSAAAYSLRQLSYNTTDVVRVRRSSDNAEADFTADEITDGTLLAWVNTDVVFINEDFSSSSGWTTVIGTASVSGGVINFPSPQTNNLIFKVFENKQNQQVRVTFTISNYVSGSVKFENFNSGAAGTLRSANGTYVEVLTVSATGNSNWGFIGNFVGDIDNFIVEQLTADGFVTTWYDQSGNGNDATQATAANQPKIVDAGVLVEDNGKPAIIYDDVDDFFSINSLFTNADGEHSVYSVINQNNLEGTILGIVSVGGYYFRYTSTSPSLLWYLPNTTNAAMSLTGPTGQGLISLNIGGGTAYAYVNNTLNNSISSTGPLNNYPNGIGRYAGGEYFGGYMQEIVAYEVNTISSRNDINTNINDYYSIYP